MDKYKIKIGNMKYLKKFNEDKEEFDINLAMSKIKGQYSQEKVDEMFDEELLEWVDDSWEEDYESEYDWYVDHNNGEAQDVVIESIISWYKKEFSKEISKDDYSELFDEIKSNYNL
jgi:hypothetical protein